MNVYILTRSYNIIESGKVNAVTNEILTVRSTLKGAQKAMAEELFEHMDSHPWDGLTCNASKSTDNYDFFEMRNMFEDDPEFTFDATESTLTRGDNEFVTMNISERTVIEYTPSVFAQEEDPDSTLVIVWPFVQNLFEQDGFRDNSALCNSDETYSQYGDSTYAVKKSWYGNLPSIVTEKTNDGIISRKGPLFSKATKEEDLYVI